MRKAKLIQETATWQDLQYARCGRTDKGVSAAGQVICLPALIAFIPNGSSVRNCYNDRIIE